MYITLLYDYSILSISLYKYFRDIFALVDRNTEYKYFYVFILTWVNYVVVVIIVHTRLRIKYGGTRRNNIINDY